MPRDANGNMTLPAGNPVVTGTAISSAVHNATIADLAAEIQDSLSRSGKGGMNAAMKFDDGVETAPSITFTNETNTGFWWSVTGLWASVKGAWRFLVSAAGIHVKGNIYFDDDGQIYTPSVAGHTLRLVTNNVARLTVSDTGIGMDERTRARIFEPFFTTKELGKGTGLGLAMVYGAVVQHSGFIETESAPGTGTSFHVHFPLLRAPDDTGEQQEAPLRGGTETILVAEDDETLRDLTRSVLEEYGYRVVTAKDGEEAVRLFREASGRVQLVLLYVIMPKLNGRAAYEEIRRAAPGMKALFVSGYSADILSKEGILDAGLDMIAKPLSPRQLVEKVREILDR
jgi:CheY-like chemotaxis protein